MTTVVMLLVCFSSVVGASGAAALSGPAAPNSPPTIEDVLLQLQDVRQELETRVKAVEERHAAELETVRHEFYEQLRALPGLAPIEPDANFVFCEITTPGVGARQLARELYVEHGILIKDCASKSMPNADRYLRIASRTPAENRRLVEALASSRLAGR